MTRPISVVALALAALLLIGSAAPVAAQSVEVSADGHNSSSASTPDPAGPASERIDSQTTLLGSGYNPDTGMAWVKIKSGTLQQITVTDAGSFMQGGVVPQRSSMLKPGETATIKVPATKVNGFVGVSVATPRTLYAVPLEVESQIFGSRAKWTYAQIAGVVGFLAGFVGILLAGYAKKRGGRKEVDRLA